MVTAIILMQVDPKRLNELADQLAGLEGVSECYSVGGSYDLVAIIRVARNEDLAGLVTERIAPLEGIEHTETLLAFKAHSRHDLESMFSLGM
ncbi:AsnC family transcriptional regulator [Alkalispirillum mobile]|uniref:AsnC family transcriptional regulator n=1 Tax=Alkalispirillum mobile TaxID=85925 RepID=A0A498BX85_9GAMM|nr:Lrp/AsnC ligand binding domain-containing protein [Alkalispirillum mobile]RLK46956.1 AsnC family transcriptional regulator [Alkalispirillum mobile]